MSNLPTVALLVPIRNGAHALRTTLPLILEQDYAGPLEILLSDQGSTDNSVALCEEYQDRYYRGFLDAEVNPAAHEVRLLHCPHTHLTGFPAINAHLNWLSLQTDAELIVATSCDDLNSPNRVSRLADEWIAHDRPAFIGHQFAFAAPNGPITGHSGHSALAESRFVSFSDCIAGAVSRIDCAWSAEFWNYTGGLFNFESLDFVLGSLAALSPRGLYYLHEPLKTYLIWTNLADNLGLEGQIRALERQDDSSAAIAQTRELTEFHKHYNWRRIYERIVSTPELFERLTEADHNTLAATLIDSACDWSRLREELAFAGITPSNMKV